MLCSNTIYLYLYLYVLIEHSLRYLEELFFRIILLEEYIFVEKLKIKLKTWNRNVYVHTWFIRFNECMRYFI